MTSPRFILLSAIAALSLAAAAQAQHHEYVAVGRRPVWPTFHSSLPPGRPTPTIGTASIVNSNLLAPDLIGHCLLRADLLQQGPLGERHELARRR